jgi:hypothetical protein
LIVSPSFVLLWSISSSFIALIMSCHAHSLHLSRERALCVSSLETLYRLIEYVGGDPEQCRREIKTWGHGGCWADVQPEHFDLLGIKKVPQSLGPKSGRSFAE